MSYFKSEADQYIFYLMELDGKQRMNKLRVSLFHYSNKKAATDWRNSILKVIHPDSCSHPLASQATAKLNELYENMTMR